MGNCSASFCRPRLGSCCSSKHAEIYEVVGRDGKDLHFKRTVLVKEILVNSSGAGMGVSEESKEQLPQDYELPCSSSSAPPASAVKRIKVVITRQQLQQLLAKQVSTEQLLVSLDKGNFYHTTSWKPKLASIPEGSD